MVDQTLIIVSAVVASLGVLSAILGFSAEGTKLTIHDLLETEDGLCIYPENPALGLGICAAVFLVIAQVIVATVGGCCGCCKSGAVTSETKRVVGIVCAVFSWIAAVVAFALLVEGAAWNASAVRNNSVYGICPVLKGGIFAGGAVLTVVATGLGLASYIMLRRAQAQPADAAPAAKAGGEQPPDGISMGQPQFPQAATPPSGQAPARVPPPPPPTQDGYGAQAPNQQFPSAPAQGYEPHPQYYPPPQGHEQV